jgi:hypothetical protein
LEEINQNDSHLLVDPTASKFSLVSVTRSFNRSVLAVLAQSIDVAAMRTNGMREPDLFSDLVYEEQVQLAERELSAFIASVKTSYGPEQASLSAEDWLEESELMDSAPRSETRNWRAATIAASARLANRLQRREGNAKCC